MAADVPGILQTSLTISCYAALLIYLVLLITLVYNHLEKKCSTILIWSIIAITFFAAACGSLAWFQQTNDFVIKMYIANPLWSVSFHFGMMSIYILFMKRLQITFKDTKYAIPKHIYKWLYFGVAIFILGLIALEICYYLALQSIITKHTYNEYVILSVSLSHQVIDFILSCSLIGLFLQRLRALYIDSNDKSSSLNERQAVIILSMSKATILACTAILSTQSLLFFQEAVYWYLGKSTILEDIRLILLVFDVIINSICVVLNFDFADHLYGCLCCGCDICCARLCQYKSEKKLSEYKTRLLTDQSSFKL